MKILTRRGIAACFGLVLLAGCNGGDVATAPAGLPPGTKPEPQAPPTGEPKKVRGVSAGTSNAN